MEQREQDLRYVMLPVVAGTVLDLHRHAELPFKLVLDATGVTAFDGKTINVRRSVLNLSTAHTGGLVMLLLRKERCAKVI
jgi:hypothetical protein